MELGRGAMTNVRATHQLFLFPLLLSVLMLNSLDVLFSFITWKWLNMVNVDMQRGDVPTSRGSQLFHNAQERITSRNPAASTNARRMTAAG